MAFAFDDASAAASSSTFAFAAASAAASSAISSGDFYPPCLRIAPLVMCYSMIEGRVESSKIWSSEKSVKNMKIVTTTRAILPT